MNNSQGRRTAYIAGTAARNIDVRREIAKEPTLSTLNVLRENEKINKRMKINWLYVLFLTAALAVTGIALGSYIRLQSEITAGVERIASYEKQLNSLTLANDDEYSKIVRVVDLDEIKRVAIEELGMVYATNDQVITYKRENSDYVRQVGDITD